MGRLIDADDAIKAIKAIPRLILDPKGEFQPVEPPTKGMIDPDDAVTAIENVPAVQSDMNPIEYAALNYRIGHGEGYEQGKADARQEPLRINFNELINVKLTDLGKKIYYHRFDKLNKTYGREIIKPSFPKEDENGYTMFHLWEFIQLYGAHFGMGAPSVVDPLEIVFAKGKLL